MLTQEVEVDAVFVLFWKHCLERFQGKAGGGLDGDVQGVVRVNQKAF